jgi:hypothetical protein
VPFDGVLWLATPARAEAFTQHTWEVPLPPHLAGAPPVAAALHTLQALFAAERFPAPGTPQASGGGGRPQTDAALAGKPAARSVELPLQDGGARLRCVSGALGRAALERVLDALQPADLSRLDLGALGSNTLPAGIVRSVEELAAAARATGMAVDPRGAPPLARLSFAHRGLRAGEALEWAAWLNGAGWHLEQGVWACGTFDACYGPHARHAVSLSAVPSAQRAAAAERLSMLLPELYPPFLAPGAVRPLGGAVLVDGSLREALLAQRLAADLAADLSAQPGLNIGAWSPAWRLEMNRALSEKIDPQLGELNGSFAGVLRQGAWNARVPVTVLVESNAMQSAFARTVRVPAGGRAVRDVLQDLASAAGLRYDACGRIVCLHGEK